MLYADDANIGSKSPDILEKYGEGDGEGVHGVQPERVRSQEGDQVHARKGHADGGSQHPRCRPSTQTNKHVCTPWGGTVTETPGVSVKISRQVQRVCGCYHRYTCDLYDRPDHGPETHRTDAHSRSRLDYPLRMHGVETARDYSDRHVLPRRCIE